MKTDLFQSCGHCWVFQICWHMEWSTFTALCFRIWNSSAGIQSPPLALVIVMLPKAHLTSHSRMPGSRWVITPSWLSGSWITFLYSSSVLFPWRTKWQPTPVSLPGESHGRRSLVGYSPQVAKSQTRLSDFTFTFIAISHHLDSSVLPLLMKILSIFKSNQTRQPIPDSLDQYRKPIHKILFLSNHSGYQNLH